MWLYQAALEGDALFVQILDGVDPIAYATRSYRRRLAPVQPTQASKDP